MYQNTVDIMGFLGADAENRATKDGVPFTVLSLATKRSWKDAQGDWQSHTDWHRVTCFGAIAEFAATLKRGAHVHVTGYLRSREVEKPVTGKTKKNRATVKFIAWKFVRFESPSWIAPLKPILPLNLPPTIQSPTESRHRASPPGEALSYLQSETTATPLKRCSAPATIREHDPPLFVQFHGR